jgi:hypothetical protein
MPSKPESMAYQNDFEQAAAGKSSGYYEYNGMRRRFPVRNDG